MIFKRYPKFVRPLASIRTQLVGGFGIILFLVLILVIIDYSSLRALQNSVETTLKRAHRMRQLSLEIENEFLLARQSESAFLSDLPVLGLKAASDTHVMANQEHLDRARIGLAELEQLLQTADDPALRPVLSETSELAPLLDAYETAFLAVVDLIPERSRADGLEQTLQSQLSTLERNIEINTPIFREITTGINRLTSRINESGEKGLVRAESQLQSISLRSTLAVILMGLLALGLGGGLALVLARRIVSRLDHLSQVARQFGRGRLESTIPVTGHDELAMLATVFNDMAAQLRDLIGSLEEQVAGRTQRLATMAVLSERLTAILRLEELLVQVVNQVKEEFGYYHTHIYLLDAQGERLVIAAGTGEAGAKMKAARRHIPLDTPTSLAARAARSEEVVRVDNVREAPDWLPNPLLPDTCAEMAVPIILEGEVAGVLEVQEDKIAGLDEGDANLLRLLANQIAVAIRNARLFEEVETALQEARRLQERYLQQTWDKNRIAAKGGRYLYARPEATPPDQQRQQTLAKVKQETLAQNNPAVVSFVDDQIGAESLTAPINLRDQTIGTLQLYSDAGRGWSEEDMAVIEAILEQLAQAADNLRLFDEIRERAGREQTIREITDKLRTASNLNDLLKTTVRELGQHLGVRHTVLELGIDRSEEPLGQAAADAKPIE